MNILVIGGSYFLGRVFTIVAHEEHKLTLLNRGTFSMENFGVKQYKVDRHDEKAIRDLPKEDFDAVVDFCAYDKDDIRKIVQNLPGSAKKYVFISTIDVYRKKLDEVKNEQTPFETEKFEGEIGKYIDGKIQLEKEVVAVCAERKMNYAVLRPSIIYGPYNYAPRESEYIRRIIAEETIPMPKDAGAVFQLVYVKDVANAIMEVLKKEEDVIYNVCPNVTTNYEKFFEVLTNVAKKGIRYNILNVNEIIKSYQFAPFPLTYQETNLCDGSKIEKECDFKYTTLEVGMEKTFNAFKNVYN